MSLRFNAKQLLVAAAGAAAIGLAASPSQATTYFSGDAGTGSFQMSDALFLAFSFGYYDVQVHGGCFNCITAQDGASAAYPYTFGFSAVSGPFGYLTNPPSGTTQSALPGYGGAYEHFDGYGTFDITNTDAQSPDLLNGASNYFGFSLFGTPGSNTITIEFDLDQYATSDLVNLPSDRPLYLDVTATTPTPLTLTDLTPTGPTRNWTFTTPIDFDFTTTLTDVSYAQAFGLGGGGAVPEPAAWNLMIVGFGALGAAMRRQRRFALAAA
jgi:hypothetical protein